MTTREVQRGPTEKGLANGHNRILGQLDAAEAERLGRHLTRKSFQLGDPLLHPGDPIEFLVFPTTAMVSAMGNTPHGEQAEVGVMGWEGAVGVAKLLGAESLPHEVSIQMAGDGIVLPVADAEREFARGGDFQRILLRYYHEMFIQVGQTAVCNVLHGMEQRLARWLLMCHDRSFDEKLRLTQEFLAMMVGVSRQSLSGAARLLQDLGYIKYSRGVIEIIDRAALERFACHCYQVVKLERDGTVAESLPDGDRAKA
jgi:CRP-like cAMP-binding protein